MKSLAVVVALLALAVARPALAACPADPAPLEAARQKLLVLPRGEDGEVSAQGRRAIAGFKDSLAHFVEASLACAGDEPAAAVQRSLAVAARKAADNDDRLGAALAFEVARPPAPGGLMTVVARFQIQCGQDAVLMVFERGPAGWRPALRWQAQPYRLISGAFDGFNYALSPSEGGGWYVLTSSVPAWCTSAWHTISHSVLRSQPGGGAPKVVFQRADSVFIGNDAGALKAGPKGFEVSYDTHPTGDVDEVFQRVTRRFVFKGGKALPVSGSPGS